MTAPTTSQNILQPPRPEWFDGDHSGEMFKFFYEIWIRNGGLTHSNPNLQGLNASVAELNTLAGIDTGSSMQEHLDSKVDI
jgi:hypothetical protein